ncbi:hypothetical protein ACQUQP_01720 [Marinobacterium sp. YM272]|uniref:hypothetical protein n=1 Tax=Marinobacterium sp. YM272 TaxID=3421654 RepID=UPI003D7F763C
MKKFALLLTSISLTACATGGPAYKQFWSKEGASYDQAVTHESECQYNVGMAKISSRAEKQQLIQSCMKMQGYRWGKYPVR